MNLESGVLQIHIEDIIPNRFQPRLQFDEEGLKELSDSIKEHGIIQPLVLRKLGDKYEIIAGERRYKAATMAGLTTVPAVISNIDDNKAAEVAIVENVQRRDLTAIEEARSYKNLLDKGYLTQEQLAKRMGLSQPAIANKLRLLNLDEEVQQALLEEKISERHARTLLSLPDKEAQKEWLHRIINERMTVRQLDLELKKLKAKQNLTEDEDNGDVPLVEAKRNIDEIKAQATDLKDLNKKMSEDDLMKPTQVVNEELETLDLNDGLPIIENPREDKNSRDILNTDDLKFNEDEDTSTDTASDSSGFTIPEVEPKEALEIKEDNQANENPFTMATSIPESNIITPASTDTLIPENSIIENHSDSNKFFNFSDSFEDQNQIQREIPIKENNSSNGFEVFNAPDAPSNFIDITNKNNEVEENDNFNPFANDNVPSNSSVNQPSNNYLNTDFDLNPNNRFFTPVYDSSREVGLIENKQEEINPMDAVDNLKNEENRDTPQQEEDLSLKTAISAIRNCIEDLGDKGFYINVEEIDFDSNYQITIQIKK